MMWHASRMYSFSPCYILYYVYRCFHVFMFQNWIDASWLEAFSVNHCIDFWQKSRLKNKQKQRCDDEPLSIIFYSLYCVSFTHIVTVAFFFFFFFGNFQAMFIRSCTYWFIMYLWKYSFMVETLKQIVLWWIWL